MKFQMNFTTSYDDVIRFGSAEELQQFYTESADPAGDGDRGSLLLQWRLDSQ